jgi:putative MATE family efflux protein
MEAREGIGLIAPHSEEPLLIPRSSLPRPTWTLLLALALPVLAQQALVLVVNLSDRFLAGHLQVLTPAEESRAAGLHLLAGMPLVALPPGGSALGALAGAGICCQAAEQLGARQIAFLAAQTTAHYLAWFISSYAILVSVGSTALVARFTGAGDRALAIRVTHQSLLLAFALGLAASAFGLGGGIRWMVEAMNLSGDAANYAVMYLEPLFLLLVFQIIETAGIACLVGAGDTRPGMWITLGIAVLNVPLSWSFCQGLGPFPQLGFVGIAVGTALSHTLGGVAIVVLLTRGRAGLKLHPHLFRPQFALLYRLLRVSVPAGFDSLSIVVGQFWFLSIVNRLGNVASSAHGIALNWEALGFLSGSAFGTAAMTLVGQNLGAGRPREATRSGWMAFVLGCGVMSAMGVVFFALAPLMFRLFCPLPEQRPIIAAGVPVLRLVAFAMPVLASTIIFTSALRGAGDTRVPVLFTWIGFFLVRIPLAYYLTLPTIDLGPLGSVQGLNLGLFGAWLAMFADLVVRGLFFLGRFARGAWQRQVV